LKSQNNTSKYRKKSYQSFQIKKNRGAKLGKIADALGKYAKESKGFRLPRLNQEDLDVLLSHDRKTGHLLTYNSEPGHMDNNSMEVLRNKGTIQRLLDHKLIYPGGKLTPKGLELIERRQKPVPDQAPRMPTAEQTVEKAADHSKAAETSTRAEEGARTAAKPHKLEPLPMARHEKVETPHPQESAGEAVDVPAGAYESHSTIPRAKFDENAIDDNLIALKDPRSYESEQFKILRSNILFPVSGTAPQSILVTGAMPGDGKSFLSANLAVSLALHINKHVLLIDCDLRKPDLHRMFGFSQLPGLSEYLKGQQKLESLLVRTSVDKLTILPGGLVPPNPSELISTDIMSDMIEEVKRRYNDRLIVIDSPPTGLAAETVFLARHVDGIILVVKHGKTPREDVEELIEKLGTDKICGVVVNHLDMQTAGRYDYKKFSLYGKRYAR
jgi:exopolysaccharide/PEP-CTERM locus tyrosine autokinase